MPRRPLHPCKQNGCPALVEGRYCPRHQKEVDAADRERRGSAASRGYDKDHRRWRSEVLDRDPVCVVCLESGRVTASEEADHIVALRDGGGWELENGQGLCGLCHRRKTGTETAARRRKKHSQVVA